jgi:hypothetical protein
MPGCLVRDAKYWFKINKDSFTTWEIFHAEFLKEFSHTNYFRKLRRELELRTQAPDEDFPTFVQKIWGYYHILGEEDNEDAIIDRVLDNMNRKSRSYVRDKQFSCLKELLSYAREVQAHIDKDSEYIPPPKPEECVEKSLAHYKPYNKSNYSDRSRPRDRSQQSSSSNNNTNSKSNYVSRSQNSSYDRSDRSSRENTPSRRTSFASDTSRSPHRSTSNERKRQQQFRDTHRAPTPAARTQPKNE